MGDGEVKIMEIMDTIIILMDKTTIATMEKWTIKTTITITTIGSNLIKTTTWNRVTLTMIT